MTHDLHDCHRSRRTPQQLRGLAAAAASLVLGAAALAAAPAAQAQARDYKVATDLQLAIESRQLPTQPWVLEAGGQRVFRVLITGRIPGSDLAAAREDIVRRGGAVLSHSAGTATVVAVLPAAQVRPVAERADVLHVAPDRLITVAGAPPGQAGQAPAVPGFAPNSSTALGRNDQALLGE